MHRAFCFLAAGAVVACAVQPYQTARLAPGTAADAAYRCATSQATRLGYSISQGDKDTGFFKAEKAFTPGMASWEWGNALRHDIAVMIAETGDGTRISVTASRYNNGRLEKISKDLKADAEAIMNLCTQARSAQREAPVQPTAPQAQSDECVRAALSVADATLRARAISACAEVGAAPAARPAPAVQPAAPVAPSSSERGSGAAVDPETTRMIDSYEPNTVRTIARKLLQQHETDRATLDRVADRINRSKGTVHDDEADAVAWLCKVIGDSGDGRYKQFMSVIASTAAHEKVKKYAGAAGSRLRQVAGPQYAPALP